LGAIFAAAEKLGMKIILGDFLVPSNLRYDEPKEAFKQWLSPTAMEFRSAVINRYKRAQVSMVIISLMSLTPIK
jgi:hypothetical protein